MFTTPTINEALSFVSIYISSTVSVYFQKWLFSILNVLQVIHHFLPSLILITFQFLNFILHWANWWSYLLRIHCFFNTWSFLMHVAQNVLSWNHIKDFVSIYIVSTKKEVHESQKEIISFILLSRKLLQLSVKLINFCKQHSPIYSMW